MKSLLYQLPLTEVWTPWLSFKDKTSGLSRTALCFQPRLTLASTLSQHIKHFSSCFSTSLTFERPSLNVISGEDDSFDPHNQKFSIASWASRQYFGCTSTETDCISVMSNNSLMTVFVYPPSSCLFLEKNLFLFQGLNNTEFGWKQGGQSGC